MPAYIVTGLVLDDEDPDEATFVIPSIVKAVGKAIDEVNASDPSTIRTIGFFEFELALRGASLTEVARLLVEAIHAQP